MPPTPLPLQVTFGQVLRRLRTEREISQGDLALDCGLDRTYISLLERGLRQPTLTTIVLLGTALKVDPAELVRQTVASGKPAPAPRKPGRRSTK